jgi:hypothetical protein
MLLPYGLFWGGDNQMQAKECSQGSLACNYFCQTCHVGSTKKFKESDEGFASLFKVYITLTINHLFINSYIDWSDSCSRGNSRYFTRSNLLFNRIWWD